MDEPWPLLLIKRFAAHEAAQNQRALWCSDDPTYGFHLPHGENSKAQNGGLQVNF
jgi:hypothetical protein